MTLEQKRQELEQLFAPLPAKACEKAVGLCLAAYEKELREECARRCAEKGYSFSIRIDRENLEFLASPEGQAEADIYKGSVGHYVKAVLEEYCELPYTQRERICFGQVLDNVHLAQVEKRMLRLTLHSKSRTEAGEQNNVLYLKPIGCQEDAERLYNYVVGMTASCPDGPWQPGTVRLTSIKACVRQARSGFVSAEERRRILEGIRRQGVQYLPERSGAGRVVVKFTPEGEKMYRHMMHLRPLYTAREGNVYTFFCTLRQADNYFFKFGAQAQVLEPKTLAQSFQEKYRAAAQTYEE